MSHVAIIGIEIKPVGSGKRLSEWLTDKLVELAVDFKAFPELVPFSAKPNSITMWWSPYNKNVFFTSFAEAKRSVLLRFENLDQYSEQELSTFTQAEFQILKIAASKADDVTKFIDMLYTLQNILRTYQDVDSIPPRVEYNENYCYPGLLGCKLLLIQYQEGEAGLLHLLSQLKTDPLESSSIS